MIPLKLSLKNFLSYGAELQTIDFSCYQLICLSGKNGHGKSALLDAITWALWGQARKPFGTTKADQNLLRLGQTQMCVILDFIFNGQTYRIRREFAKTYGKPYAVLEFGLLDAEKDELIPLTDKTIRQTQAKIEQLLNLDMESFVNSAFLRQGHSNEFSKKSAKERKEVLATILGLNRYESVRSLAMEKAKQAAIQKQSISTLQEKLTQELQHKERIEKEIGELIATLTTCTGQETAMAQLQAGYDQQKKALAEEQKKYQQLNAQLQQSHAHDHELQAAIRTTVTQWRTTHKKIRSLQSPKELEERKINLVHAINEHQQQLQKSLQIKEQLIQLKDKLQKQEMSLKQQHLTALNSKKIDVERHALSSKDLIMQRAKIELTIAAYAKEMQEIEQRITAATIQADVLSKQTPLIERVERQFERRKEYYQKFIAQGTWIKNELESLTQKKELVHDDDNPSCPLCEQNLSATRKKFLKNRFEADEQFLTHRLQRLRNVSLALKELLIEQHKAVSSHKKLAADGTLALATIEELRKHADKLAAAKTHEEIAYIALTQELNKHEHQGTLLGQEVAALHKHETVMLQQDGNYMALVTCYKDQESVLTTINYKADVHQQTAVQLAKVEQELNEYAHITQEIAHQTQRQETVAQSCVQLKKIRAHQNLLVKELAGFKDLQQAMAGLEQHEATLQTQTIELRKRKEQLLQERGALEQQQARMISYQKEYGEQQALSAQLTETIHDYQAIALATGKDGIQALLIEEAIPEIEQEANRLLAKLTNNTAQIFIESLRDLKSGGTKETLDIKISDNVGIRPYELFSGGEAFRIDFALRIAISKLLARRAGTSLQTLIIDEGFGSQDEDGLGTIMDALYKIQEDFSKVIIVSHLPAMKDQFPVHFLVEKGPNGSIVRVMEQG